MAPDVDVPALVGEVCPRLDPPEDIGDEAGLLELAEPGEAPAGALAEDGLLAEPETPLG